MNFKMIDVGRKRTTRRRAVATGTIIVGAEAFKMIAEKTLPKGDVLALAEIAGIMAAKNTPDLIPLCHTLPLDQVTVDCELRTPDAVVVYCQAAAYATTGVEMEALAGVNAALLTIWDLVKGTEPALRLEDVRLLVKEGGKSGLWIHPEGIPEWLSAQLPDQKPLTGLKAVVVVMSDRASEGAYEDRSGPVLREILSKAGAEVLALDVIADDREKIIEHLRAAKKKHEPHLIISSGGTGLSGSDVTPDALNEICDRLVPGFGEMLRKDGADITDMAWLSRSVAGTMDGTLVIALPGSPKAVREGFEALLPLLPHAVSILRGGNHG